MYIPLDVFGCTNCGAMLRSRQVHRGTECECPYCAHPQTIPGRRKSFFGKLVNLFSHGLEGMPQNLCPFCFSETFTFAVVCHRCCRDLPPLV